MGLLLPGQDMCNRFSLELATGRCAKPPAIPFLLADLRKKPWAASQNSHIRALGDWAVLRKSHKRPSGAELSFQSWAAYIARFILDGGLSSAWDTFGGLSAMLSHFGDFASLAATGNPTIAQTYDSKLRAYADERQKFRKKEHEITKLLSDEDKRANRELRRDCNSDVAFAHRKQSHANKQTKGDMNNYDKGAKEHGGNIGQDRRGMAMANAFVRNPGE